MSLDGEVWKSILSKVDCPDCTGKGYVDNVKCGRCDGLGWVRKSVRNRIVEIKANRSGRAKCQTHQSPEQ